MYSNGFRHAYFNSFLASPFLLQTIPCTLLHLIGSEKDQESKWDILQYGHSLFAENGESHRDGAFRLDLRVEYFTRKSRIICIHGLECILHWGWLDDVLKQSPCHHRKAGGISNYLRGGEINARNTTVPSVLRCACDSEVRPICVCRVSSG